MTPTPASVQRELAHLISTRAQLCPAQHEPPAACSRCGHLATILFHSSRARHDRLCGNCAALAALNRPPRRRRP